MTRFPSLVLVALLGPIHDAWSQDWPQWRGPHRDGAVLSFEEPAVWPETLTERWVVDVGLGYAGPVLIGNRLFVFTRVGDDEVMRALDAATGDEIWRASYPAPFELNPYMKSHGSGPKATPTYAGRQKTTRLRCTASARPSPRWVRH